MEERPSVRRVVANILYNTSSSGQPTRFAPSAWGLGEVLKTRHRKNVSYYEMFTERTSDFNTTKSFGIQISTIYM